MNIAIIGAGNVGSGLAARLVAAGHRVTLAASRSDSPRLLDAARDTGALAATTVDAVAAAEMVILAVPYAAIDDLLDCEVIAALGGKVVVDATNPLASDFMSLTLGHTTSAGEQNAARLPGSDVVKAFNTVMAATLAMPELGGVRQLLPVAGDNEDAKAVVMAVADQLGFDAVDSGPLSNSRYLEPVVELLIQLAYGQGLGADIGFHLARA